MFQVLNPFLEHPIEDKYAFVEATLCQKLPDGRHSMTCIKRKCKVCGILQLEKRLQTKDDSTICKWNRWELKKMNMNGNTISRNVLISKEGPVKLVREELLKEAALFASHLFVADWQHKTYTELRRSIPPRWLITTQDFAENYRCVFSQEIQSAFYNYSQATLFTQVSVFHCVQCNKVCEESCVFVSDDLKHDSYAVETFQKKYEEHLLKSERNFEHQVIASDGAAAHFKARYPFMNLTRCGPFTRQRIFFGSHHGKSQCDGLGGVVKSAATVHVASEKGLIRNAKEFFLFADQHLAFDMECPASHKSRKFFFIDRISRPKKAPEVLAVPQTRMVHDVRAVVKGCIDVRELACFCVSCLQNESEHCSNASYTGPYRRVFLSKKAQRKSW